MNPHRKGNAFDANVPGDPRLHDAINRRTPQAAGAQVTHLHSGTIIGAKKPKSATIQVAPLHIVSARPRYIPEPPASPAEGYARCYVVWGTLNNQLATNWDDHYDINATTYFFAKATLRTTDTLKVESWEIVTGAEYDTHVSDEWLVGDPRPSYVVESLGAVIFADGKLSGIANSGGGSLLLSEHITSIEPGTGAGEVKYGKQLSFTRLNY